MNRESNSNFSHNCEHFPGAESEVCETGFCYIVICEIIFLKIVMLHSYLNMYMVLVGARGGAVG
jgi:hypothetical protein